jgi:hypothetical protein
MYKKTKKKKSRERDNDRDRSLSVDSQALSSGRKKTVTRGKLQMTNVEVNEVRRNRERKKKGQTKRVKRNVRKSPK